MKKSIWPILFSILFVASCNNPQNKHGKKSESKMPPKGPVKVTFSTPAIKGYGDMHYFKDVAVQPDTSMDYKILFFIVKNDHPKKVNFGLEHMARMINILSAAGVKQDHIHIVGVITGKATACATADSLYKKVYSVANPNDTLLTELTTTGHAKLYVCSQALAGMGYDQTYLNPNVKRALSAISTVAIYQLKGYAMLQF
ncbi:MAG TPA: DsrE family protein [Balneolales bacterium]|nr:DsrE family protein [Balneolales bacterium]